MHFQMDFGYKCQATLLQAITRVTISRSKTCTWVGLGVHYKTEDGWMKLQHLLRFIIKYQLFEVFSQFSESWIVLETVLYFCPFYFKLIDIILTLLYLIYTGNNELCYPTVLVLITKTLL